MLKGMLDASKVHYITDISRQTNIDEADIIEA
jgi:hypothetical protein